MGSPTKHLTRQISEALELNKKWQIIPHATDQQAARLRARIKTETDPVAIGEFEGELEAVMHDASAILPRLVWSGVLVSMYAAFEYGVHRILDHWRVTVSRPISFML